MLRLLNIFLKYSAKSGEKIINIAGNFDENYRKIMIFAKIRTKIRKSLTNFCEYFEFGAVRRCVYLVDLEKC